MLLGLLVGSVLLAVWWRPRRRGVRHHRRPGRSRTWVRAISGVLAFVLLVGNVAAGVNAHYAFYPTLADALGTVPDELSLADALHRHGALADGVVVPVTVPPAKSGFTARQALVYLPPAWFSHPRMRLPVVMLMHGTPGGPFIWAGGGEARATADAWAQRHDGVAPVIVMPDINGSMFADTECVDGPRGRAETYLTADVPAYVVRTFHTQPPGARWAAAGLSEGGMCSLMLALRHPTLFGAFVDLGGLAGPRSGETNAVGSTVRDVFAGSVAAFDQHEPADLLRLHRRLRLAGWFEVAADDARPLAATRMLDPLVRRARIPLCTRILPFGGHTVYAFRQGFADALPWLAARLGLLGGRSAPGCPPESAAP